MNDPQPTPAEGPESADSPDVLVVGAGPTGLAVACGLRQYGIGVRVLDRAAGPATTSRANILFGRGVEVLDRLGALAGLEENAIAPERLSTYTNGRPLLTMRLAELTSGEGVGQRGLYVSQARIEARLRQRLADLGGTVEWDTALAGAEQDTEGVTARRQDGSTIRTGWLVGADGSHSVVRKTAGIGFPGVPVIEQFLLADVRADWAHDRAEGSIYLHRDGVLMAIPMLAPDGSADLWRLMANVQPEDEPPDEQAIVRRFGQLLAERAGESDVRIREATWTSVFRIHRRLADDYRRGRLLLAGDAAHTHSPVGGQGMNTGLGDAENLAWKLALVVRGQADPSLLDSYQAERRPLAESVLRTTTNNTKLLVGEGAFHRFVRDRLLVPVGNMPSVQRRNAINASQLTVSYRRGPLAAGSVLARGRGPRPGDRVPDRQDCVHPDGTRTRLHAELGGHWALLLPPSGSEACVRAANERLGDRLVPLVALPPDSASASASGGTSAGEQPSQVWLVRPDAHLAWRGGSQDAAALGRWLDEALRTGRVGRR